MSARPLLTSRRELIALVAVAPTMAVAQVPARKPLVAILWHAATEQEEESYRTPLMEGFRALGYVAGENVRFEERYPAEKHFAEMAGELAQLRPDVILAVSPMSAVAVKQATAEIPTVFLAVPDPVGLKLVPSLSRPAGNTTGLSTLFGLEIWSKRIQLLKQALPNLMRLALLTGDSSEFERRYTVVVREGAERLGVHVDVFIANAASELEPTVTRIEQGGYGALLIGGTPLFFLEKKRLAELALARRLPTMAPADLFTDDGATMSYSPSWPALFRRAAWYVDRILKGTPPGEIPVEQPTNLVLVVNMKTASALGLDLPPTFLNLADRVIE